MAPGEYMYGEGLLEPAAAIKEAYWCAFLNTVVGQVGSLQSGSVHGLLAAISDIKPIFGRAGGDVNEAYADIEFGGITDGIVLTATEEVDMIWDKCGEDEPLFFWLKEDLFGEAFPFGGDCILCDGVTPKGDVDGLVEVVDPDDFNGGEQLVIEWDRCGLWIEDFDLWVLFASEKSLGERVWFFGVPLLDDPELILEVIMFDSILLQALVSIASGLIFESYWK